MKKILNSIFLIAGMAVATQSNAQLPPGTTATDFTLTDINGVTHNLYSYLDAGKTVIIDISATWCGPCWGYHQTHALKDLYLKHGPTGTCSQDVIVLFIEGDTATNINHLNGTDLSLSYGDWVSGTPYPIIDLQGDTCEQILSNFMLEGFPSLFRICPDKKVYEFDYYTQGSPLKLEQGIGTCVPVINDISMISGGSSMSCGGSIIPTFTIKNTGTTTVTTAQFSYNVDGGAAMNYTYTGSLLPDSSATITFDALTGLAPGEYTINCNVLTVNGMTDEKRINNCFEYKVTLNTSSTVGTPFAENFETNGFPYANWLVLNADNNVGWTRFDSMGIKSVYLNFYNYSLTGQKDELILPPMNIAALANPTLTFDLAYTVYDTSIFDKLQIYATKDCGINWVKIFDKEGLSLITAAPSEAEFIPTNTQWRNEQISLSGFSGEDKVFIKFVGTNGWGNNLFIDNINVSEPTGINSFITNNRFNIMPNPVNDKSFISFELSKASNIVIKFSDINGKEVLKSINHNGIVGNNIININTTSLSSGSYFVTISDGEQSQTLKFVK